MIVSFDYLRSLYEIEPAIMEAIKKVLHSEQLVNGPETKAFEREFAEFVGVKHCIGVSSGTTAVHLAMMGLGVGQEDEVITVSNTCVPTIAAVRLTGAKVVFVDVRQDNLMMDVDLLSSKLTSMTKCILPVHLWGNAVDMEALGDFAQRNGLYLVEDCAQAHGTLYKGRQVGSFGIAGCFSFYPTKNIGAYGDAGAIVTDDTVLANRLRSMRMYGYDRSSTAQLEGMNARISEIQAAILRVKLRVFPEWLKRRKAVAAVYNKTIKNKTIKLPFQKKEVTPSYHQYVIRCSHRSKVIEDCKKNNISYAIHYPIPVHLMPAYNFLGGQALSLPNTVKASQEILSLPIHENISEGEATQVANILNTT
jgi:aminotransferase EvaB